LKKVVVVVGRETITFEGEELRVSNNNDGLLVVRNTKKQTADSTLGVFKHWRYWKEVKVVGSTKKKTELTYGDTDKLAIINNEGVCVASLFILPDGNLAEDSWIRYEADAKAAKQEP